MSMPASIETLVARFQRDLSSYKLPEYNETQLRREFVDPFFEGLGWDVNNRRGHANKYKSVIHEDSVRVEGAAKSPDYSFRVGGVRRFFVETKKPSVNIKDDPLPAFQLRRYAWSAQLPLSVLTDFEELAIYDTRHKPKRTDKAGVGRVALFRFEDYAANWGQIADLLSEEAVLRGSLERFVADVGGRRGSEQVDDAFLEEIESWRVLLAKDIAKHNSHLSLDELNSMVQVTIDRIVFLRISEDRGIESADTLRRCVEGGEVYKKLLDAFRRADDRYNSGLFHFRKEKGRSATPDALSQAITVSDKALATIIRGLYFPSPYAFSLIPADILGQVYERFLGKVIRLTPTHRAVVEDKPEVREQGGVYYTPTYIVDGIVGATLGRLTHGKSLDSVAKLTVLDPACGSGTFLLQAYQYLLDWHLNSYLTDGPEKYSKGRAPVLRRDPREDWELTIPEKRRILLENIFGVDVDPQAVEVTKLSLLLKVLEGDNQAQLALLHERVLPDLDSNIRCGNSIVGPDYYVDEQLGLLSPGAVDDLRAFDWWAAFPKASARGGFDAVIGNPPYVLMQWLKKPEVEAYFKEVYGAARYKIDTFHVFLEKGIGLLREGGVLGYITPSSYLRNKFAEALRGVLLSAGDIEELTVFTYPVFKASVDTATLVVTKRSRPSKGHEVTVRRSAAPGVVQAEVKIPQASWADHPQLEFGLSGDAESRKALKQMASHSFQLGAIADAYFGIQTHDREKFVARRQQTKYHQPVIDGVNIQPFYVASATEYVDYQPSAIKSGGSAAVYSHARIGVRQIGEVPIAALLPPGLLTLNTVYNIYLTTPTQYSLEFILGVISSTPAQWYWRQEHFDQKKTFPKIKKAALLGIPIPAIDFSASVGRERYRQVEDLVRRLGVLATAQAKARPEAQVREVAKRFRDALAELDGAVGDLYGLCGEQRAMMARHG